jgi:hypothetical protein
MQEHPGGKMMIPQEARILVDTWTSLTKTTRMCAMVTYNDDLRERGTDGCPRGGGHITGKSYGDSKTGTCSGVISRGI